MSMHHNTHKINSIIVVYHAGIWKPRWSHLQVISHRSLKILVISTNCRLKEIVVSILPQSLRRKLQSNHIHMEYNITHHYPFRWAPLVCKYFHTHHITALCRVWPTCSACSIELKLVSGCDIISEKKCLYARDSTEEFAKMACIHGWVIGITLLHRRIAKMDCTWFGYRHFSFEFRQR